MLNPWEAFSVHVDILQACVSPNPRVETPATEDVDGASSVAPPNPQGGTVSELSQAKDSREIIIRVTGTPWVTGWSWETEVLIDGGDVGGGTAPSVFGAFDIAQDVLFGDDNDYLNGSYGALHEAGLTREPKADAHA